MHFVTRGKIHNNNIFALYHRPASAHVPLILLLCTHDDHRCDARAKKKSMCYIFPFKGKWVPPTRYHPRAERPVPVRYIYFFSVPEIQPPVLSCPSCAILYYCHPRDCPAPLYKAPRTLHIIHRRTIYNGQGFPHARGPLEYTRSARSRPPPPRPVRLEPDRSARTYTYADAAAAAHARTRVTGTVCANNAAKI